MPTNYTRSRAKSTSRYDGEQGRFRPGGNPILKSLLVIVPVVALVVVLVILKPWSLFVSGGAQPTLTPETTVEGPADTEPTGTEPTGTDPMGTDAESTPGLIASVEPTVEPTATPQPYQDFTISAVGDLLIESSVLTDAKTDGGDYDFAPMFAGVKDSLSKADLTIGTLESTLAGKDATYSGSTKYNTPESILPALKDAGFDMLNLAHTHIFDKGFDGLTKTIGFLDEQGIKHTGAYLSSDEYHQILYYELPDKGIKIAIVSYSADEKYKSTIGDKISFAIKHINLTTIKKDVEEARPNADVVIVMLHWGDVNGKTPSSTMKTQAEKIIGYGADLIIGSHPYYMQKIEKITATRADNTQTEGLVAYSLGSLISGQQAQYKDTGTILNVTFRKDAATNMVSIQGATYVPTWVYLNDNQYAVLPAGKYKNSEDLLGTLSSKGKDRIKKAWDEAHTLLGEDTAAPADE